jgi:hypothetical protein
VQHPQHLHHPHAGLGDGGGVPGLDRAGGRIGVDWVGLALAAACGPVGPVDLDHLLAGAAQVAAQPSTVGAGPLDPERDRLAELAGPAEQVLVAGQGGGHQGGAKRPAELVARGRDVQVAVGVHADGDARGRGLCDGGDGRLPSSGGGWHLPVGRADSTATSLGATGS